MRIFIGICLILSLVSFSYQTVNKNIVRKIDISSHLVKINTVITVKPDEENYVVTINPDFENYLSFIGASSKDTEDDKQLTVVEASDSSVNNKRFNINVGKQNIGKIMTINLKTVYGHKLMPFPSEIKQSEKQYIKFIGNLYFYSPYATEQQETQVITTSSNILSYSQTVKPFVKQDKKINYGPYKDVKPLAKEELIIHYENNSPFLTVTSLNRLIEISLWGNIAVEETIDISHSGAKLKGSFSRYDYQRLQDGISSIKSFTTVMHAGARDVYYRDEIGNISTSHLKELSDSVEIELRPRFPLFGGWKTRYTIGYNVPSYEFLYNKNNRFGLKMRFVDHVYDDQLIDEATVRVVLPEEVSDISLKTPYPIRESPREIMKTYLDITGRTVLVLHKSNLVDSHIQDFEVHFTFNPMMMAREPLMIIVAFYTLFILVIFFVRLDFSIAKDEASESKMRISGSVEELESTNDKRSAVYQLYDDAINKYKASKDLDKFAKDRKRIEQQHKLLTQQITEIKKKLGQDSTEHAEKVKELQNLDSQIKELFQNSISLAEKVVNGKMQKPNYLEVESTNQTKRTELMQKMEKLIAVL